MRVSVKTHGAREKFARAPCLSGGCLAKMRAPFGPAGRRRLLLSHSCRLQSAPGPWASTTRTSSTTRAASALSHASTPRRATTTVAKALHVLDHLEHRGAAGAEIDTGDGAGILLQVPDEFFREVVDFELPEAGSYAVGMLFLPKDDAHRRREIEKLVEQTVAAEGQELLGWRDVPGRPRACPGRAPAEVEPCIRQVFVGVDARRRPGRVRAQGLRDPPHHRARGGRGGPGDPVVQQPHDRLQGHAHQPAAAAVLPGPARRARQDARSRSSTRASPPTRSRAGSSRTRTG